MPRLEEIDFATVTEKPKLQELDFNRLGAKPTLQDLDFSAEPEPFDPALLAGAGLPTVPDPSAPPEGFVPTMAEQGTEAKTLPQATKHGYRRGGVMMVKQLAGLSKMAGEFIEPGAKAKERAVFPALTRFWERQSDKMKDWSNFMLKGVEEYYDAHPEEAIQIAPNLGYLKTLNEYITKPQNLLQGLVESAPLMLEGVLGNVAGGMYLGIAAMGTPISGEVYADARKEGTEPLTAMAQAVLTGAGEATIEQWTLGRKLGLLRNFRKMVAGGLPKVLWEGTKAFFRGTAEEGTQEFNRNFWQWVFTDRSQPWLANVTESMAAGGPMEMVMAGAFTAAGSVGPMVSNDQKLQRVEKIRTAIDQSPNFSEAHKSEVNKELDKVSKDVEKGEYDARQAAEVTAMDAELRQIQRQPPTVAKTALWELGNAQTQIGEVIKAHGYGGIAESEQHPDLIKAKRLKEQKAKELYNALQPKYKIGETVTYQSYTPAGTGTVARQRPDGAFEEYPSPETTGKPQKVKITGAYFDVTKSADTFKKTGFPSTFKLGNLIGKDIRSGEEVIIYPHHLVNGETLSGTIKINPEDVLRNIVSPPIQTELEGRKPKALLPTPAKPTVTPKAAPVAERKPPKLVDLGPVAKVEKPIEEEIDETGGISKRRRNRLIKQAEQEIEQTDLYQTLRSGLEDREIGIGYYYIPEKFRSEVEDIIGKKRTKLRQMFTFKLSDRKFITLPTGEKAEIGPTDWTIAVQEQLGRGKEGIAETEAHLDISDFVQRVKDAFDAGRTFGRLNTEAVEAVRESGDPWLQYKIGKLEMLHAGYSAQEIDDMTAEFAEDNEIPLGVFDAEWVGPEPQKLKEIKAIKDEAVQDRAIEALAKENVLRKQRDEAKQAVKDILKANKLEAEVRKVEEIEEDDIPFERRGPQPTGATITRASEQIVLLAYGADSATGYHEGYHVLRRRLTQKDIIVLNKHFKGNEEAEATAFAEFVRRGKAARSYLKGIWRKLVNLLRKIKSELQGRGFRTVNDIFGEIQAGRIVKTGLRPGAVRYERGVFGQPIERQLRLPFKERQAAIKRAVVAEKAKPGKKIAGKPYEYWRPRGRVKIKAALIKAVDAEIEKTMKPRSNDVQITPEQINAKLSGLFGAADFFYNPTNSLAEVQEAYAQLVKGGPLFDIRYETTTERLVREAVRKAQVKAEKARLKARVKPKKARKGRIKINIRDVTPVLREDLKPLEVPPPAEPPRGGRKPPYFSDAWYQENIKKQRRHWLGRLSLAGRRIFLTGEKILTSSSTRLYNIHPELFRQTRRYIYDVLNRTAVMVDAIDPFLKGAKRMKATDQKQLDLALKNSDSRKITEMVVKYKLQKESGQARDVLDEIFDTAKEVGIDIEYQREYWHRHIKDPQGFLEYFQGREDWSIIEQAIKRRAERAGRKIEDLTDDEKAQVVNTLLRGFRTQALILARPGAAKERTVDVVWSEIDQFYDDFGTAIIKYIKLMNAKIAEREFFGRETKEIQNLRKLQSSRLTRLIKLKRREGLRPGTTMPEHKEHISKTMEAWKAGNERLERLTNRSPSDTIGGYVYDLVRQGQISPTQEKQVQDVLRGIFAPKGMGWGMGLFSTGIYLDTLNSPIQALTQLDEFAYSFYRSPLRSIPVAIRTAFRRSKIEPRDIGIRTIGMEFQGPSMKRALTLLLKSTGFELVDRLNKENYINTVLSKYQAQARSRKESPALVKRLARVFGKDYKKVLEDLRRPIRSLDDVSDNVKYLLFNEILDIQPIAITEMPEAYNKAGGLRILYTLKTFYIKRLDFLRNEAFKDMKSPKTFLRGFSKLVWLSFAFALFGAVSDFLKDWVKGRAFDLWDSFVDNMLRMVMSSKFQVTQAQKEGLGRAALEQLVPPTKVIDEISKDVVTIAKGKDRGFELWRSVPVVGELYYWWFGRGREKIEKKEKESW